MYVAWEDYCANLIALKKLKVKIIDFAGGKSLLAPRLSEFSEMLEKVQTSGFLTTVTTNCLLYPKQRLL